MRKYTKKEEEWESENKREIKGFPRMTSGEVLGPQLCSRPRKSPNQTVAGSQVSGDVCIWGCYLQEDTRMYKLYERFYLEENCIARHFTELLCSLGKQSTLDTKQMKSEGSH